MQHKNEVMAGIEIDLRKRENIHSENGSDCLLN